MAALKQDQVRFDRLEAELRAREASVMAGASARLMDEAHKDLVKDGKRGIGFGVEWLMKQSVDKFPIPPKASEALKKKINEKRAEYYVEQRDAYQARGVEEFSCLTAMDSTLPSYAKALDFADPGKKPEARTKQSRESLDVSQPNQRAVAAAIEKGRDARGKEPLRVIGGRGTVVLEELRTQMGFETVHIDSGADKTYKRFKYYTPDAETRKTRTVPNKASPVTGADSEEVIDTRVRVDHFVKLGKHMDPESQRLWDQLNKIEYGVGIADTGYHTFVISAGKVYQVHWDKAPTDSDLTDGEISLKEFFQSWRSGVIAVPPATLKPESKPARRPVRNRPAR
jgi:hypothetical protein